MSSNYSVYVGPYLRCVNRPAMVTRQQRACGNTECSAHGRYSDKPFCSSCGGEVRNTDVEVQGREINIGELYEDLNGRMSSLGDDDKIDLWVPNGGWSSFVSRRFENKTGELVDGADRDAETRAFKAYFGRVIGVLESAYGAEAVEIKWGAIGDWN